MNAGKKGTTIVVKMADGETRAVIVTPQNKTPRPYTAEWYELQGQKQRAEARRRSDSGF